MFRYLYLIFNTGRYLFTNLLVAAIQQNIVIFCIITNGVWTSFLSICNIILQYFKEGEISYCKNEVIRGGWTLFLVFRWTVGWVWKFFFSPKPSAAIGNHPLNFSFLGLAVLEELKNEWTNKLQTHRLTDSLLLYRKDGSVV